MDTIQPLWIGSVSTVAHDRLSLKSNTSSNSSSNPPVLSDAAPVVPEKARSASLDAPPDQTSDTIAQRRDSSQRSLTSFSNADNHGSEIELVTLREVVPVARLNSNLEVATPLALPSNTFAHEGGTPARPVSQGVPTELRSFTAEIVFVLICSTGQLLFAGLIGDVTVNQEQIRRALDIPTTQITWILGAFSLANALSVVISGSLADILPPKTLILAAFAWLAMWNVVGAFSLTPRLKVLFFIVRAMQGLSVGVLVSASMSILGRIYTPGVRKTRVFSFMAALSPLGFCLGALQGGALTNHIPWIFWSNAILSLILDAAALYAVPSLRPAADAVSGKPPSLHNFDFLGAGCAMAGSGSLLFGMMQGASKGWPPVSYISLILGVALLVSFFFVESRVERPLIPNRLWRTPGFTWLMIAFSLGMGSFLGAWQFYALQFWLRIQHAPPMTVALYIIPNGVAGVMATWIVSRTLHAFPGHYIFMTSMFAYLMAPVFFLPQSANTNYFALSMPGVALSTFGPDLSFAAASIFITSSVARSHQGAAGSLLVSLQNLSGAIVAAISDSIGARVDQSPGGEIGLRGLRAIWWFGFALTMVGLFVTLAKVRIAKAEEKEHVS